MLNKYIVAFLLQLRPHLIDRVAYEKEITEQLLYNVFMIIWGGTSFRCALYRYHYNGNVTVLAPALLFV